MAICWYCSKEATGDVYEEMEGSNVPVCQEHFNLKAYENSLGEPDPASGNG